TVPRFGYRWIAPVESVESAAPAARAAAVETSVASIPAAVEAHETPPASEAPAPGAPRPSRRIAPAAAAPLALPLAAPGWSTRPGGPDKPHASENVAAVLPVSIAQNDAENAWIRLGAMDYIAARLRDSGNVAVLPSSQIVALIGDAGGDDALQRVAQTTGARWLVQPRAEHDAHGW